MDILPTAGILVGIAGIGYAALTLFRPDSDEAAAAGSPAMEERELSDISDLWTSKSLDFISIARLWRPIDTPQGKREVISMPRFTHRGLEDFWLENVEAKPSVKGIKKHVIRELMMLLDREGDCSSVVDKHQNEAERKLKTGGVGGLNTYQILRERVTLLDHTLRVAKIFATKVSHAVMLPDALIIALGHDIGKIPRFYDDLYRTGDHPILARYVLDSLPHFAAMPNRKDIEAVILKHHFTNPGEQLVRTLRDADMEARQEEIAMIIRSSRSQGEESDIDTTGDAEALPGLNNTRPNGPTPSSRVTESDPDSPHEEAPQIPGLRPAPAPHPAPSVVASPEIPPPSAGLDDSDVPRAGAVFFTEFAAEKDSPAKDEENTRQAKIVPLPSWYDRDLIMEALAAMINRVDTLNIDGRAQSTYLSVSTAHGEIWYQPEAVYLALRKASRNDPEMLAIEMNTEALVDLTYSVLKELDDDGEGPVIWDYAQKGFFTARALITTGKKKTYPRLLVPMRAAAFGMSPGTLEALKMPQLKSLVADVRLKNG